LRWVGRGVLPVTNMANQNLLQTVVRESYLPRGNASWKMAVRAKKAKNQLQRGGRNLGKA